MIVREYRNEDLEAVVGLFTETVRNVNRRDHTAEQVTAWAPEPPDLEWWRERLAGLKVWVAEGESRLLGFGALGAEGHVELLYVGQHCQRQGVGGRLYRHMEAVARQAGMLRLSTEASITARPFFERMGFRVVRERRFEFRGVRFLNYAMARSCEDAEPAAGCQRT